MLVRSQKAIEHDLDALLQIKARNSSRQVSLTSSDMQDYMMQHIEQGRLLVLGGLLEQQLACTLVHVDVSLALYNIAGCFVW